MILSRLLTGAISTQHEQEEHKRYFLELKSYFYLMSESADVYRDQHTRMSSILVRNEQKLKSIISYSRTLEGSTGLDLVESVFPKIRAILRDIKFSLEGIDTDSINDMSSAHTWVKFKHSSGPPLFDSSDSTQLVIRKLASMPVVSPNFINLYVGKVNALIGECFHLDDVIHLSEDARFESYRLIQRVQTRLQKILGKACHFRRHRFYCGRRCLIRDLRCILCLITSSRPHWTSPESRESRRYCDSHLYQL